MLDNSEQVASTLINSEAPASEDVAPANTVQTITENLEDTSDKGADEGNVFNNHLGYNPTYLSVSWLIFFDAGHTTSEDSAENETLEELRPQSPATPHKIVLDAVEPSLTSPSNALSQLSLINGALKKTTKSRRK